MRITSADFRHRLLPIVAAQVFALFCGIGGVALVTRTVNPADYGIYGVFVSLATVGASVVFAGLLKFISRHWLIASDRPALLRETIVAMTKKTPWLLGLCGAATLIFAPDQKMIYGGVLFVSAVLITLAQLGQAVLQAERQHWRDLGVSVGQSATRSFVPPLVYSFAGAGFLALLAGFLLHAMVGSILGVMSIWRWRSSRGHASPSPRLRSIYAGPQFMAVAATGWLLIGLNRWVVVYLHGAETGGYFALATNLGGIAPWMIGVALLQYAQPQWFATSDFNQDSRCALLRSVDAVAVVHASLALAVAALLHLSMPWLTGALIDVHYENASEFIFMTACSATASTTAVYYHTLLMAARLEQDCARIDLTGAGCVIVGTCVSALGGMSWFKGWLVVSVLLPWIVNRTLARRALFRSR